MMRGAVRLLIRCIPPFLVRFFARPYVAGDSLAKAMEAAAELWHRRGLSSTLDLLAESIESQAQVGRNLATYMEMVDAVAKDDRFGEGVARPTLSLKPSSFTGAPLDRGGDGAGAAEAVERICESARECSVDLTIDMEDRHWTDWTLDLFDDLFSRGHRHLGCVLQSRLNRTEKDLERLPAGCRVRLVIGIYEEPEAVAQTDKRAMKERMLEQAQILLQRGHFVEFATHDDGFVRRFVDEVVPRTGVGPDRFELQMLYGVPRDRLLREMLGRGVRCRVYVPFALGWPMAIRYLRRRLDEAPEMMWMVARNVFRRG